MFNFDINTIKAGLDYFRRMAVALEGIHKELSEINEREYQKSL